MSSSAAPQQQPVVPERLVLFDGVCGLCDSAVQWLLDHDQNARLHYAPLQGPTAEFLRQQYPDIPTALQTIVYVRQGQVYLRSQAVLQILRELPSPWSWVSVFRVFPSFLTDIGYRLIAAVRYRIWGKLDACRMPEPEQAARFLD